MFDLRHDCPPIVLGLSLPTLGSSLPPDLHLIFVILAFVIALRTTQCGCSHCLVLILDIASPPSSHHCPRHLTLISHSCLQRCNLSNSFAPCCSTLSLMTLCLPLPYCPPVTAQPSTQLICFRPSPLIPGFPESRQANTFPG